MTDDRERGPYAVEPSAPVLTLAGSKPAGEDLSKVPFGKRVGRVMRAMAHLEKDGRNAAQNYDFLSEANVKAHFNRALCDNDLFVAGVDVAVVEVNNHVDEGKAGRTQTVVTRVQVVVADVHSDKVVSWVGLGSGSDRGDKAAMKANTAAYKYAVTNGCVVSTGDDPEDDPSADLQSAGAVVTAVKNAKTSSQLDKLKQAVVALRGTDEYEAAKEAYNNRRNEIG